MADARRRAAWLLDTGPVLILATIAGAGSFVHLACISTTYATPGTTSPPRAGPGSKTDGAHGP